MKQTTLDSGTQEHVEYRPYKARKILNTYTHVDYWFWNKYSAHPYVGCEHACEYCYARADKYLHTDTPDDFSRIIKVKRNAAQLLKKELQNVEKNVIITGDYQPVEKKARLSREMLNVVCEAGFPVHVVEKSDFVVEDADVLQTINERTWACVSFSFSTVDEDISGLVEPVAPSPERRLQALKEIADAGIVTGANLMPILPFITDSDELMEDVVKQVKHNGGTFVLAGGLTLDTNVRERYFRLLKREFPDVLPRYETLYRSELQEYSRETGKKVGELCKKYGIKDRIPRYCLYYNQRVAENLFDKVYRLELENPKKAWPYRRAAWAVDELEKDIRDYQDLTVIPGVGEKMAALITEIMKGL
jgi:DNA repair photolyase